MFSNQFFISFVIMISIPMLCLSQTNRFCSFGQLDTAVRTDDDRIFIFYDSYLTEFNGRLEVHDLRPIPINNVFKGLNFDRIDAAFTADGHNNPNRGKTYLIREEIIKEFSNVTSTGLQANMSTWVMNPIEDKLFVINQIDDRNAIFLYLKRATPGNTGYWSHTILLFDSIVDPYESRVSKMVNISFLIERPETQEKLLLRAAIGLSNESYLLLYNPIDVNGNGKYCLTQILEIGCSQFLDSKDLCKNNITTTRPPQRPPQTQTQRPTTRPTETSTQTPTPSNRFCSTGRLDSGVRTKDGRIFVFFDSYLTEFNDRLEVQDLRPIPIRNVFQGLPNWNRINAAFTAEGHNNPNAGKTYLIRRKTIKEFSNVTSTGLWAKMDTWKSKVKLNMVTLIISKFGESIAVFFNMTENFDPEKDTLGRIRWLFNSIKNPTEVVSNEGIDFMDYLIDTPVLDHYLILKAVIGLSNNSYLLFYNPINETQNGKYCITRTLSSGCFDKNLDIKLFDSKNLCLRPIPESQTEKGSKSWLWIVFIVLIILFITIATISIVFVVWKRNKNLKYRHNITGINK